MRLLNYPVKAGVLDKRFGTEFRSLGESKRSSLVEREPVRAREGGETARASSCQ